MKYYFEKILSCSCQVQLSPATIEYNYFLMEEMWECENLKQINITNPRGQSVFAMPLNDDETTSIDLSGLSKDIYFIHLNSTEGVKVKKILIN
jgi:hypothetical protein